MRIYFVRHGESEANVLHVISNRDLPHQLTDRGIKQALTLASAFERVNVTKIFSSPILRARQTAEILGQSLGLTYKISDALREYDCGILEGRSGEAVWKEYSRVLQDWMEHGRLDSKPEAGESFLDMQNRFVPFIDRLVRENPDSSSVLLLVSHGGIYRCMLPMVLTNVSKGFGMTRPIPHTGCILAESTPRGLLCVEWCGERVGA